MLSMQHQKIATKISARINSLSNLDYNDISEINRPQIDFVLYRIQVQEIKKSLGDHNTESIIGYLINIKPESMK